MAKPLSPRQRQVLELAGEGHSNRTTGERLGISSRTVEIHRATAVATLGAANITHAAVMLARMDMAAAQESEAAHG